MAPKAAPTHPPYAVLIKEAIASLKVRMCRVSDHFVLLKSICQHCNDYVAALGALELFVLRDGALCQI